jgi:hypothetical protein
MIPRDHTKLGSALYETSQLIILETTVYHAQVYRTSGIIGHHFLKTKGKKIKDNIYMKGNRIKEGKKVFSFI